MESQFKLLMTRRFLPLFLTQFLGAFNDNLFKNALVVLVTFRLAERYALDPQMLIAVIAGVFILPFFLFSATAGQLADKYEKSRLVRIIKFVEIALMVGTSAAFAFENLWGLMLLLFLMGAQSTFFGPIKYSILPSLLNENELIAGNGLIEAGTYVAILTGTLCGGLLILHEWGIALISFGITGVAVAGYVSSLFVPKTVPLAPNLIVDRNIAAATRDIIASVVPNKTAFHAIIGITFFWFVGAVFIAQFPTFAKLTLGGDEKVSTLMLFVFSIAIGVGSMFCNKLLRGRVTGALVPWAAGGVSAATLLLYISCRYISVPPDGALKGVSSFLSEPASWFVLFSLALVAFCGGVYSVPLYAIMQKHSDETQRARVVACANVLDSFGMVMSTAFIMALLYLNFDIPQIFLAVGVVNTLLIPVQRYNRLQ